MLALGGIEALGRELDAIRQSDVESRGAADAAYIRRVIDTRRKLELVGRAPHGRC
jgi:hypothetical protein